MTVVMIDEENHGNIAVAKDFESAKDFLINEYWIDEDLEIFLYDKMEKWDTIKNVFGEDWETKIRNMTLEEFEETFENMFYLHKVEVYGA